MDVLRHIRFFEIFFKISAGWQMCGAFEICKITMYRYGMGMLYPFAD